MRERACVVLVAAIACSPPAAVSVPPSPPKSAAAAATASATPPAPAASVAPAPRPVLTVPKRSRAEIGVVARYPEFSEIHTVGGRVVLSRCDGDHHTTLRILDPDLLHGRDIATRQDCGDAIELGDALVIGSRGASGAPGVAVHIPSGVVEPFVHFTAVLQVAGETVLTTCGPPPAYALTGLRVLDHNDVTRGRDFVPDGRCSKGFYAPSYDRMGDALVFWQRGDGETLFHVPAGTFEPYVPTDGGQSRESAVHKRADRLVIGKTVYLSPRLDGKDEELVLDSAEAGSPDGVAAFDADTKRRTWHSLHGATSVPVPSEGTLIVRMPGAIAEVDPRTGEVLWERGAPGDSADLTPFALNGADGFATRECGKTAHCDWGNPEALGIVLYVRGAPPEPAWTGKIYGTVTDIGMGNGRPYKNLRVTAGTRQTTTDTHGKYEITLTTRGIVTVDTEIGRGAGSTSDRELAFVSAGHGDYKIDLRVGYFDQAFK